MLQFEPDRQHRLATTRSIGCWLYGLQSGSLAPANDGWHWYYTISDILRAAANGKIAPKGSREASRLIVASCKPGSDCELLKRGHQRRS